MVIASTMAMKRQDSGASLVATVLVSTISE